MDFLVSKRLLTLVLFSQISIIPQSDSGEEHAGWGKNLIWGVGLPT